MEIESLGSCIKYDRTNKNQGYGDGSLKICAKQIRI